MIMTYDAFINEKMVLKNWDAYSLEIAEEYSKLPNFDKSVLHHWDSLNISNYNLFKRLLTKVNVSFCTSVKDNAKPLTIKDKVYDVFYLPEEPYQNQKEMKLDYDKNKRIIISIDNSTHPYFTVIDNIVFRTVHDFIVHILGDFPFGLKGELQSYNLHSKLASREAVPSLFTEVVGQVCYTVVHDDFPIQKVAIIKGYDYYNIGL